ncbi:MAG: ABC transporter ATP-binding protein [Planctomycetota bacterium]|nr:MAG: ABC transporter ATP-binding protein [Planctomycetota bacterium]
MPLIELEDLHKEYATGAVSVHALRAVNLNIEEGEYVAIMGPSGSGKSTLLNILGCLDKPTAGHYLLGGRDVSMLDDNALSEIRSRRLGFVFQSYNLIAQLSVLENIEVPLFYQGQSERAGRRRAQQLAEMVGLGDRAGHKPAELSGGERQRVAIARALANDPLVILADEPTGNLDSATGKEILRLLDELHRTGRTMIMVTHNETIAGRAERLIRLLDGRIESDRLN